MEQTQFPATKRDYEYSLLLGLIIGVFLIPTIQGLNLDDKGSLVYLVSIFGLPIMSLLGLFICNLVFFKIPVLWQFTKFGLIGVSNTVINFGVLNFLASYYPGNLNNSYVLAIFAAVAFSAAVINSYIWNSHWSFSNSSKTTKEFVEFISVTFIGLLINSSVIFILSKLSPGSIDAKIWLNISNLIATVITMIWNFAGFKFLVFKENKINV